MPFLKVDFHSHDSNDYIQRHVHAQFVRFFRPVHILLAFLCCRIPCMRQRNRRRRWISECHKYFFCLLHNPPQVIITILQLQGVLNLVFLIYWDRYMVGDKLRQRLQDTTTGFGVVKRKSLLNNIHLGAIICGSFITILMVTYKVARIIAEDCLSIMKISFNSNFSQYLQWLSISIFVYVAFTYPAIYAEVCSFISIVCAEYRALNDDFVDDCNTYQLAVIRHYVRAHWKMSQTHALFIRSVSLWMSFHLITSSSSCIFLYRSVSNSSDQLLSLEPIVLTVLICTLLLIAIAILQIISSMIICLLFAHNISHFRYILVALIAGSSVLQEQAYSVAIAYINHLYRYRTGISFFEITIIDKKFIEQVTAFILLISAMYYFNDFNKYSSNACSKTLSLLKDLT
ncbi:unnamed protein product [Thelazia callipaeda]|uniref:Gustatory receptor n=1 Tax=Thelazia callipaeda TaxID=103827 RepID=A0A0N5CN99_THECL|nr:unnamed protein product [Thelazia callipaeda]